MDDIVGFVARCPQAPAAKHRGTHIPCASCEDKCVPNIVSCDVSMLFDRSNDYCLVL